MDKHKKRITILKKKLIEEFSPEKIILFGSFANNKQRKDSTIDILIIAKTTLPFLKRIKKAIEVADGSPAIEPIIYTPDEVSTLIEQGEGFIEDILNKGITLYSKDKVD